jgi:uncharacterized membrane protein YoaK (UPF0700 family)
MAQPQSFGRREATLALLALASASSDVLSFLFFHQVFTSAMTGNTALLGIALGQGQAPAAWHAAVALAAFVLGVVAGAVVAGEGQRPQALTQLLGLEALCLGLFAALWYGVVGPIEGGLLYPLIALAALGMGLQIVAARQVNLPGIPTVVVTSTLASIIMHAVAALRRHETLPFDAWRQGAVFASYAAGALLAGAVAAHHAGILVLLPLGAVLVALALRLSAPPQPGG